MDEDRRLLMGGSVCFGKFMVDVESLSHAAEKRIKDIGIHTSVDRNTHPGVLPVLIHTPSKPLPSSCYPPSLLEMPGPQQPSV